MNHEKPADNFRTIQINASQSEEFVDNSISTTKYRSYTFVPLFLFNQFRSYSNIFFLVVAIVQQLPGVSPLGRYTTVVPLTIILLLTAIKEIIEDIFRYREDLKVNNQLAEVWRRSKSSWQRIGWKRVRVGQLVRVRKNEELPADLLLVRSSDTSAGTAYVDTVNLDGESNLKVRRVAQPFLGKEAQEILVRFRGHIMCDQPNEFIYTFYGTVVPAAAAVTKEAAYSVNKDQLMLRGAILKNTDWIWGICIYTGVDTKIWRNSQTKHLKRSTFDVVINWHMMVLFAIFIVLTISNSIMYIVWNYRMKGNAWYLPVVHLYGFNLETFLTFAVSYSTTIPISLQIYCELVHLVQAKFINSDVHMFDEQSKKYAEVRTSALNADLGVVKYVFTDKTGTLTQNRLVFKSCSIEGHMYSGEALDALTASCDLHSACYHFFLAVCLVPGIVPIFDSGENEWKYYSSSTDQVALVTAAKRYGFELRRRTYERADVMVHGNMISFEVLSDIEFTSERKRTTVIVRSPQNEIVLYMMGADDAVYSCLSSTTPFHKQTATHVNTFAISGLRTMCVARAVLRQHTFQKWKRLYQKTKLAITNRQEEVARAAEEIERNLCLLGAVAQEDKLQDQVPQTISTLLRAGVKVWMLTGDKQETAVNIGYSTRLLDVNSTVFVLDSKNLQELKRACVNILGQINKRKNPTLVISGYALSRLINSDFVDLFIALTMACHSVICCRMIPLQKAQIVHLIQNRTNQVTLAIGDGANDVAMIQTAAIGVGISGYEGLQAAYAADYSIAQFKYLRRLLLVHGTLNYYRMGKIILYIYYKNLPIALILFYLSSASGWSGATIFDDWAFTLYNVAFTDGATLVLGVLEKDFTEDVLLAHPAIYSENSQSTAYVFYAVLLNAALHGALILFFTLNISKTGIVDRHGFNDNYMVQGNSLYTYILIVVVLKSMIQLQNWTWTSVGLILASASLWFPFLAFYNWVPINFDMIGVAGILYESPTFWVSVLVVPFASLLCDLIGLTVYRCLVADVAVRAEERRRTVAE